MPASPFAFDLATTPDEVGPENSLGVTEVAGALRPDWGIGPGTLNGGYVQAFIVSAVRAAIPAHSDVVAVSSTYVAPAAPGPVLVEVRRFRSGRSVTAASGTARQGDTVIAHSVVTLGDLPDGFVDAPLQPMPPTLPPLECLTMAEAAGRDSEHAPGLTRMLETRFPPDHAAWLRGEFLTEPRIRAWVRLRDGRPLDSLSVLALSDMLPPVTFALGRFGWAPTLQLQVGVFARPSGQWLLADLAGSPYDGAFVCEDCDLWDETGQLVGRARQVALPPRRRPR